MEGILRSDSDKSTSAQNEGWWVATVLPRALRFKRPLHRCNACNPKRGEGGAGFPSPASWFPGVIGLPGSYCSKCVACYAAQSFSAIDKAFPMA